MPTREKASNQEKWKARTLKAAQAAKRGALAVVRQADTLLKVARQKAGTMARRSKLRQRLRETGRVLKSAGKAALAAGAAAAMVAVAGEIRSRKATRKKRARKRTKTRRR
ncbi:MAG TPA: hypothetical protein VJ816_08840 [Gemmatimonadales bacterium]|nr:hypothetical protein [Gemmatimonadales bacterium]